MFRHVASFLANGVVPRGPVMGYHMAPWQWFIGSKFMESVGIEPRTSPFGNALVVTGLPLAHTMVLIYQMCFIIFELYCNVIWGASKLGLSPSPGRMYLYI